VREAATEIETSEVIEAAEVRSAPNAILDRPSANALLAERQALLEALVALLIAQLRGVLEPLREARNTLLVAVRQALLNSLLEAAEVTLLVARDALLEARDALLEAQMRVLEPLLVAGNALLVARNALLVAGDALLVARNALLEPQQIPLLVAEGRAVLDTLRVSLVQTLERVQALERVALEPERNAALPRIALTLKSGAEAKALLDVASRVREAETVNGKTNLIESFDRLRNTVIEELQPANINLGRCIHVFCLLEGFRNHCGPTPPMGRCILFGRQPGVVVREIRFAMLVTLVFVVLVFAARAALVFHECRSRAANEPHGTTYVIGIVRELIAVDCS